MNLDFSDEQELLRQELRKLLAAHATLAAVRTAQPVGFCPALWETLTGFGLPLLRVPEAAGGSGLSLLDAIVVAEESGRHLAPAPVIETLVAARVLAGIATPAAAAWLDKLRTGAAIVTLALPGPATPAGAIADAVLALDGEAIIISARTPARRPARLAISPIGPTAHAGTEAITLAAGTDAHALMAGAIEEWKLLNAAAVAAAARRAVELAADYARERKQFGQPIGAFQAIGHPLADSLTEIEGATLLTRRAAWAIARGRGDAAAGVSQSSWWAAGIARRAARRALRTFGGYGLSLEYDIQLFFRWISAQALLFGDPEDALVEIGDRLWLAPAQPLPPPGAIGMEFGFGEAADRYAEEVRAFFRSHMTDALRAMADPSTDGHDPEFHRALAAAGLAYPDWPNEWGGSERTPFEVSALAHVFEEFRWTRVPIGITAMGARMVMMFGSPELRQEVLPRIGAGEALSCLGFTEPEAGSDVYSTRTRARREGDHWVIEGQKMFTTGAHISDYVLLLTRTDPEASKHRGLTLFFVPLNLEGVAIQPVHTLQDERTNITFYGNVIVPDRYRLGEVNDGIGVMAAAMKQEHSGEGYHIYQWSLLDSAVRWAKAVDPSGRRPIDDPDVRRRIAEVATHTLIADLLCRRAVWAAAVGKAERAFGPMSKLFATETYMADAEMLMEVAAPWSLLAEDGPLAEIERMFRQSIAQTIYGGTSEVHRSVIAETALHLPRGRH
ncbi:acyl-CoA dehydrogenase [Flavisphingomonas formosensis]|uniref:acyl-CoA dehydrogenase n=1 Tax=Flavisphingomonas formosensis TaxID=861534 RepID=UPI0012FB3572|nr:acyl-CoA dehydrogenase [Sphingomonas formosensis]